jgi:hypothetical protein
MKFPHLPESNRHLAALIVWLFFLGFVTVTLRAQTYESFQTQREAINTRAPWRLGPFRIDASLRFDFQHDSNIYSVSRDRNPVSDYVATVSVPLTFYLLYRDWLVFSFLESPQGVYYFETKSERSFNNSYSPALRLLFLHRFVLSGAYQYSRAKERYLTEVDTRVVQTVKGWLGSFFYETARNTSVGLSWSELHLSYGNIGAGESEIPIARGLNRREKAGSAEFYYGIFPEAFFFLKFGLSDYRFDDPEARFKDSYAYRFDLGIRLPTSGRLRGMLSLGYKKFIPRQQGLSRFSGIVGDTNMEIRLGRMNFRLLYQKDVPFSYSSTEIFYRQNNYGTGVSLYLSQNIRLDYNFVYGENGYPESQSPIFPDGETQTVRRKDIYRTHSASAVFRIIRSTGIGVTANYYERVSDVFAGINRLVFGAFVDYDF